MIHYTKRCTCSSCGGKNLVQILDFGDIPLAGYFPRIEEISDEKRYQCGILVCDDCGLVQVDTLVDPEVLFEDYRYTSSVSLSGHFTEVANQLNEKFGLMKEGMRVLEIGSNDGVLLDPMTRLGISCTGFEPSKNISQIAIKKGCDVIVDYFSLESAKKYDLGGSFEVVVANNVFAHINDLSSVIDGIKYVLNDNGVFVAEVHYLLDLVQKNQYDFIYHEHIFYHSLYSLKNLFSLHGMRIYDFERIPVHSGSIRIYVDKGVREVSDGIGIQISEEIEAGITNSNGLSNFSKSVLEHVENCREQIKNLVNNGREIVGFGASGRGNIFCNVLGIGTSEVKYIFDQSPERINRLIPGCNIPIIGYSDKLREHTFDIVLIFAWNYANMIASKIKAKDYLVLFPDPYLVKPDEKIQGVL